MKKFLLIIMMASIMVLAFGCAREKTTDADVTVEFSENEQKDNEPVTPQKDTATVQQSQNVSQTKPAEKTAPTVPDYKNFSCRNSGNIKWKQVRFTNERNVSVHFEIPSDWTIKETVSEYQLFRKNKQIGKIAFEKPTGLKNYYEYNGEYSEKFQIVKIYQVNWYHTDDSDTVDRYFEFNTDEGYKNIQVCISIDYTELDDVAAKKLSDSAMTIVKDFNNFPKIEESNGSEKMLLAGNSFINSSRINVFLNDMLQDKGYSVTSVSRDHAQVLTYSEDAVVCDQIARGEYSYLFLCGFYNLENAELIKPLIDACAQSDTKLIVFPAHNESDETVAATLEKYSDLPVVSWKHELDALIKNGVDKYTLCHEGGYEHSTIYAGYVGAHMLYRNLFGEIPPMLSASAPLMQSQVDGILGDYAYSMHKISKTDASTFNGTEYKTKGGEK